MVVRRLDLDKLGAFASTMCAVHCVLTGLALGLLSVVGLGFFASPVTEGLFLVFAVVLGGFALWHGRRKHHSWLPALVFAGSLVVLGAAHSIFERTIWHHPVSAIGGLGLVGFHLLNARLGHRCGCGCHR